MFADLTGSGRDDHIFVDEVGALTVCFDAGPAPSGEWAWLPPNNMKPIARGVGAKRHQRRFVDVDGDGKAGKSRNVSVKDLQQSLSCDKLPCN